MHSSRPEAQQSGHAPRERHVLNALETSVVLLNLVNFSSMNGLVLGPVLHANAAAHALYGPALEDCQSPAAGAAVLRQLYAVAGPDAFEGMMRALLAGAPSVSRLLATPAGPLTSEPAELHHNKYLDMPESGLQQQQQQPIWKVS